MLALEVGKGRQGLARVGMCCMRWHVLVGMAGVGKDHRSCGGMGGDAKMGKGG